jgi:hypothetical protein
MATAIRAGVIYALIVFLIGFIFGTVRVLLLAPHLGATVAVSLEAPIMLIASWFVSRRCLDWLDVPGTVEAGSVMGAVAFAMLISAEFCLAVLAFGRSATEHLASYASVAGAIGLAGQILFATFPVVQFWRR